MIGVFGSAAGEAVADPAASLALAVVSVIALIAVALLLPWIRAQIVATRDAVISPSGRTVAESAAGVESEVAKLTTEIASLRGELAAMTVNHDKIEGRVDTNEKTIADHTARIKVLEEQVSALTTDHAGGSDV